ncbi:SpoIIE family protein phosphatase [Kitasatospora sp. NPDC052896]|uniref:SpoIIE family protein phosphatase n=1 Tax=Kitasatospora sp. NPDC052896 TaxID=3364061 RepID=UPI0037CB646A
MSRRGRTVFEEAAVHPDVPGPSAADASVDAAAAAVLGGSGALLRAAVEQLPLGVAVLDQRLYWRGLNPAFTVATGLPPAELLGRSAAATPLAGVVDTLYQVLADGLSRPVTVGPARPRDPAGQSARTARTARTGWTAQCRRLEPAGQVAGLLLTVLTPPATAETATASTAALPSVAEASAAQQLHELGQARARLALLDAAADRIGTTLDIDATCAELADFTVARMADLATVEIVPHDAAEHGGTAPAGGTRLHRTAVSCKRLLRPYVRELPRPGESVRHPDGSAAARSLESGRPVLASLRRQEPPGSAPTDPETSAAYRAAGLGWLLAVPLAARGHVIGVLSLARTVAHDDGAGFTTDEIELVQDLAGRAAISVDNARRYTRSQGIALELQRALLAEPGNPHPNLELASRYLPSGTSSVVGGDWYETVRLPFGRTLLVMGDVMGHGVEAAVDMSNYRSMLRYVASTDLPPHRILRQLDTLICENESARPATCLLALADPARNRWTLSSAGHLPPALLTPGRPNEFVDVPTGPPLGTGLGGYEQATRELLPDQVLLLYTDGLVERREEDIDASLARLGALTLPAAGDLDDVLDAVLHGLTPHPAEDDIALLAARVRPRPASR